MTYRVVHHAYCGMTIPLGEGMSYRQAQARIKRRIAWFKKEIGGPVTYLGPGHYELEEPEDCAMVPDDCGTLAIKKEVAHAQGLRNRAGW
jgi:hypothetical protein